MKKHTVTVFGNETDPGDQTALLLIPALAKRFPKIEFIISDPTESLEPPKDVWVILDTAIGITQAKMIDSLDDLEYVGGSSVHDFDVYMELRLQAKLGKLPPLRLLLIPQVEAGDLDRVTLDAIHELEHLFEYEHHHE
jgi:hypothetical protein